MFLVNTLLRAKSLSGVTRQGVVLTDYFTYISLLNSLYLSEVAEEPGRVERAPIASWEGMRRSEKAKVSEEAARRKGGGGGPMEWRMG